MDEFPFSFKTTGAVRVCAAAFTGDGLSGIGIKEISSASAYVGMIQFSDRDMQIEQEI